MKFLKSLSVLFIILFISFSINAQDIFGTLPTAFKTANTAAIAKNFEKE